MSAVCDYNVAQYKIKTYANTHTPAGGKDFKATEGVVPQIEPPPEEPLLAELRAFVDSIKTRQAEIALDGEQRRLVIERQKLEIDVACVLRMRRQQRHGHQLVPGTLGVSRHLSRTLHGFPILPRAFGLGNEFVRLHRVTTAQPRLEPWVGLADIVQRRRPLHGPPQLRWEVDCEGLCLFHATLQMVP